MVSVLLIVWTVPVFTFWLRLSTDYTRAASQPIQLAMLVLGAMTLPYFILWSDWRWRGKPRHLGVYRPDSAPSGQIAEQRIRLVVTYFRVWWAIALAEIVIEGEVPAVSYVVFGGGDYRNFGIPTVHGAILAAALALTIQAYTLGRDLGSRQLLLYATSLPVYSLMTFARKGLMVTALFIILYEISARGISFRQIRRVGAVVVLTVLLFVAVGESRTSGPSIHERSRIAETYEYVPSGAVWFYMYLSSPIENLSSLVFDHEVERDSTSLDATFGELNPFASDDGDNSTAAVNRSRYWLTNSAFNVSTGLEPMYRDGGLYFVGLVCFLHGGAMAWLYFRRSDALSLRLYLLLLVVAALQIFSNNLGNLNVVAAFPMLIVIGRRVSLVGRPARRQRAANRSSVAEAPGVGAGASDASSVVAAPQAPGFVAPPQAPSAVPTPRYARSLSHG
jgi:oligosaccharide repeat unit polymerase